VFAAGARPEVAPDLGVGVRRRDPDDQHVAGLDLLGTEPAGAHRPATGEVGDRWSSRRTSVSAWPTPRRPPASVAANRLSESISRRVFPIQYAVDCCTPRE